MTSFMQYWWMLLYISRKKDQLATCYKMMTSFPGFVRLRVRLRWVRVNGNIIMNSKTHRRQSTIGYSVLSFGIFLHEYSPYRIRHCSLMQQLSYTLFTRKRSNMTQNCDQDNEKLRICTFDRHWHLRLHQKCKHCFKSTMQKVQRTANTPHRKHENYVVSKPKTE